MANRVEDIGVDTQDPGTIGFTFETLGNPQDTESILRGNCQLVVRHGRGSIGKLARASTHWLRHSHRTQAVDMDIALTVVRDNLGHSSIAITSQFVHADKDARHSAISEMLC